MNNSYITPHLDEHDKKETARALGEVKNAMKTLEDPTKPHDWREGAASQMANAFGRLYGYLNRDRIKRSRASLGPVENNIPLTPERKERGARVIELQTKNIGKVNHPEGEPKLTEEELTEITSLYKKDLDELIGVFGDTE